VLKGLIELQPRIQALYSKVIFLVHHYAYGFILAEHNGSWLTLPGQERADQVLLHHNLLLQVGEILHLCQLEAFLPGQDRDCA